MARKEHSVACDQTARISVAPRRHDPKGFVCLLVQYAGRWQYGWITFGTAITDNQEPQKARTVCEAWRAKPGFDRSDEHGKRIPLR